MVINKTGKWFLLPNDPFLVFCHIIYVILYIIYFINKNYKNILSHIKCMHNIILFKFFFVFIYLGVDFNMPTVRDKEGAMYIREWSGGLMIGYFEANGRPIFTDGIPKPFEFQLLPEDWDHIRT